MAMKSISPSNTRDAAEADKSNGRKWNSKLDEIRRLATFSSKNVNIHSTFSKGLLAKMGFIHTNEADTIHCDGCGFTIELSTSVNDLIEKHLQYNSECLFISNNIEIYANRDQTNLCFTSSISQHENLVSNSQISTNSALGSNDNNRIPQKFFLNTLSEAALTKLRTNTFSNWSLITPNAQVMINAGFYYTNISDRVICVHCDALFHKWTETDRPYHIHQLKSPRCPFVIAMEKNGSMLETTAVTITTEPPTQVTVNVVDSPHALSHSRLETFQNWPDSKGDTLPPIQSFVDAGFYYTGCAAVVRCFYCNGALRNWQTSDDPKIEHARWFPHCAYIRQYVGEDLYQAIQRKNRELKAQQNNGQNIDPQTSQTTLWSPDEIDRMVKARLDLPIVEKLRTAGFSIAIIRKTFEMQLRFKKDDFKADNDLQIACLILELQVKLVNGNEANLLVPQDWMKTHTEKQEQHIEQMELSPPQVVIKTVEAPKVVPSVKVQPTITQPPADDAVLCAICMTTERQVACLPCGHLTSCVACGHSLKTCPMCRAAVKAFVRIYM